MNKNILLTVLLLCVLTTIKAQQPLAPPTIEERLKRTNEVLQQELQFSATQQKAIEAAFKNFFTAEDKFRKDNPPPPPPPPDPKVKEVMDKLVKERDEAVKKILTAEQYKKYTEAAKKLHPPKPGEKNGPPPPPQNKQKGISN